VVRTEAEVKVGQSSAGDEAVRRSAGFWLLSRLFLEVPTAARLAELRDALAGSTGDGALLHAAAVEALRDPDATAVAFTRHLCLGDAGAGEPLPFESHVREGRLPGENTEHVAAFMAEAGYELVAPEATSPDHLGAELRFMALLCHDEAEAWRAGDATAALAGLALQKAFLRKHPGQWAAAYCRGLAERAGDGYVRTIATVAATTITEELAVIDELSRGAAAAHRNAMAPAA